MTAAMRRFRMALVRLDARSAPYFPYLLAVAVGWLLASGRARAAIDDALRRARGEERPSHPSAPLPELGHLRRDIAELGDRATRDALTGLPNRGTIARRLDALNVRPDSPSVTVALLDLDHFKRVNDEHGHDAGDAVLKSVAERLAMALTEPDWAGRWGGEEFIIVWSGNDPETARERALTLRTALSTQPIDALGLALTVSCSIGVAPMPEGRRDLHALVKDADEALLRAKKTRDTVVLHGDNTAVAPEEVPILPVRRHRHTVARSRWRRLRTGSVYLVLASVFTGIALLALPPTAVRPPEVDGAAFVFASSPDVIASLTVEEADLATNPRTSYELSIGGSGEAKQVNWTLVLVGDARVVADGTDHIAGSEGNVPTVAMLVLPDGLLAHNLPRDATVVTGSDFVPAAGTTRVVLVAGTPVGSYAAFGAHSKAIQLPQFGVAGPPAMNEPGAFVVGVEGDWWMPQSIDIRVTLAGAAGHPAVGPSAHVIASPPLDDATKALWSFKNGFGSVSPSMTVVDEHAVQVALLLAGVFLGLAASLMIAAVEVVIGLRR